MSTTALDLRKCAENLCQTARDEASRRAALSRVYYASFHACKDWHAKLPALGTRTNSGGGVHEELLDWLANPNESISEERSEASILLYKALLVLRMYRTKSDYKLEELVDGEQILDAKEKIVEIFQTIKEVPPR